ncbi:DUF1501 domain-containing protein [Verrucomicrobium sp. BvORR106]|uniref:DUF1501 domain-containing protein n=1 Tax=Verrucomicrobium sp. BvORR106 TaxID=1403819 RepID=UPI00056F567B|nr:DUF1501 domain-containing protein [Verrucomicrobium sp. BvORR106]
MNLSGEPLPFSRRRFLQGTSSGFGYLAFSALSTWAAEQGAAGGASPLAAKAPHFAPRAKRVIFLCMSGGPSHLDTFDYKPKLVADDGKESGRGRGGPATLLAPRFQFKQHGHSGLWISELFPQVAGHADDLCLVRSMHTDLPNHPQAFSQMHTGTSQFVRPSLGSWALYGLGTLNENLPGFITINPPAQNGGAKNYGSAFLPAIYQGTKIGAAGFPGAGAGPGRRNAGGQETMSNISNPRYPAEVERTQLDFMQTLNRAKLQREGYDPQIEGVIQSNELAFRMQNVVPQVMDLAKETEATKKLYGLDNSATETFGRQCLMARRFAEAGVRFIEVSAGNWDQHRNLTADLERNCSAIDQPIAGLLTDLKQRGLLKDTLVMWGGEFGRTPHGQSGDGRDHNNKGFTLWMAGGGVKGGLSYGSTDDYGYEAVENKVHIHDWHATILALLGLDHEKLTYRYAGRDFRLTDVHGNVVKEIMT